MPPLEFLEQTDFFFSYFVSLYFMVMCSCSHSVPGFWLNNDFQQIYNSRPPPSPHLFLGLYIPISCWEWGFYCSVTKSCLTLCDPYGLQHTRLLCPSLSLRVCSNSHPLSQWCYLISTFFAAPFFCLQSFPAMRIPWIGEGKTNPFHYERFFSISSILTHQVCLSHPKRQLVSLGREKLSQLPAMSLPQGSPGCQATTGWRALAQLLYAVMQRH